MPTFHMLSIAIPFALAFAISLALVPIARLISVRLGFVATPRADRWNKRPVALFGGVAIAATLFLCAVIFRLVTAIPVLIITAALMFLTGFVDDVLSLKPSTKLIAQIALASVLLFFDYRLNWLHSVTFDGLLTLFWIVGLTNAFNLIDNMDGLCGGIAIVGALRCSSTCCRGRAAPVRFSRSGTSPFCSAPPAASWSTTSIPRRSSWATAAACCSGSALRRSR